MDQEFENSQVLEKAFEDEVTGELPDTPEVNEQLKTVLTAVDELNTIEQGVRHEGVSQEDMEQVFTIIKRLNDAGIECGVVPSMEEHALGHYTKTRSIVNHALGLESIGGTILNVIKIVIEKLIAFIADIVKNYRLMTNRDRNVDNIFRVARNKTRDVQEFIHLLKRVCMVPTAEIDAQVLEYAKSELTNTKKIPRSGVGLAALFDEERVNWIKSIHTEAEKTTRQLRIIMKHISRVVDGREQSISFDLEPFKGLENLRELLDDLKTEQADPEYLIENINLDHLLVFMTRRNHEPIVGVEYLMKAFYDIAGELRNLKRFKPDPEDPDFTNNMAEVLQIVTKGFEDLDLIVRFFTYVKDVQLQVHSLQLRILNRHASLLYNLVKETTVHEATAQTVERAFDSLSKKLRTYGI